MNIIDIDKLPEEHDKEAIVANLLDSKILNLEFIYDSHFQNTKILRDFMDTICYSLGLSDKTKSRFILIADEFNNNAIEYGTKESGRNKLRINTKLVGEKLEFIMEVEDDGQGKSPKKALDMETMRAHRLRIGYFGHDSIRGRGLFLITVKLVDRLYFKDSKAKDRGLIVGIKTQLELKN